MKRKIIEIDEVMCVGCGNCVPNCHQGALQIIEGKARLISDLMCEGIGACVGTCPTGAMTIEEREAEPYDEKKVMEKITAGGPAVIKAHLDHLEEHQQTEYLNQARQYLREHSLEVPGEGARSAEEAESPLPSAQSSAVQSPAEPVFSCPGTRARRLKPRPAAPASSCAPAAAQESTLQQWPVQLHLLSPRSPFLKNSDLLLAADCTAYACGSFHSRFLQGKSLAIACPKLDHSGEIYQEKLTAMINQSQLKSLTVLMMEVPCCSGLLEMARRAAAAAERTLPIRAVTLSLEGKILKEEDLSL